MWLRIFNKYMLVISATGNAWPEALKRATLLHRLGAEEHRIFYALPDTGDTVATAVTALEKYFVPKVNVVVEQHAFRQRRQAPHQTVVQYVAVLRDFASKCGFDEKTDEIIWDQLIEHVTNPSIREKAPAQTRSDSGQSLNYCNTSGVYKLKPLPQMTVFECMLYSPIHRPRRRNICSTLTQICR